jgi:2-keto-4-pentenoate hydratase/2-oxohepta-3-ene-1,7-dioic acid hydratase in catechol pathway
MKKNGRESLSYRLVTFGTGTCGPRAGVVVDEMVFDLARLTDKSTYATILGVLNDWESAEVLVESAVRTIARNGEQQGIPLDRINLFAPVLYPPAVYCAGANYADHAAEMAARMNRQPDPDPHSLGLGPWHFIKTSRSLVGSECTVRLPAFSKIVDWEAELAVVVGRTAKDVPVENALNYIAGYTIANDLSARDLSRRQFVADDSPFKFDWIGHKSFDGSCPVGPWIVPAREVEDPQDCDIKLWVNDVIKQDSNTSKMIFTIAEQIAHLSARITLYPGDLVLTGTPAGVGASRGESLKAGDVVKIWIEGIGTLTTTMG